MELFDNIHTHAIVQRFGWVLVHFVWQAATVALVLAILLKMLRKSSANLRYIVACLALVTVVLLPVVTMNLIPVDEISLSVEAAVAPKPIAIISTPTEIEPAVSMETPAIEAELPIEIIASAPAIPLRQRITEILEPNLPYLVMAWLVGVLGLSVWYLGAWTQLQKLRRKMVKPVDESLRSKLKELSVTLGVNRAVELVESALVEAPAVVGWLKPVILLPASVLTGFSTDQIEAILAHELAHIKRCDYLVNMLQTGVEILGFYHPAVWWISKKIRIERENCCDDIAVKVSGDRMEYAKTLALFNGIKPDQPELAVAASGGSLFQRICRLAQKDSTAVKADWKPSVIAALLVIALLIPIGCTLTNQSEEKTVAAVEENNEVNDLSAALEIEWVSINDPGVDENGDGTPDHEPFNGYMSKYETTNAQYCKFLNEALASGDITVVDSKTVVGAGGSNAGEDFVNKNYYDLAGRGYTYKGATNGGAARINYNGNAFTVDSGFDDHPVTYVSWYGATAFCNYYGYRLPTEWQWQAVADYDGSFTFGCGKSINKAMANYQYNPTRLPEGTSIVGSYGTYGYGMCDMAGNVWEWTSSIGHSIKKNRIVRGGSWHFVIHDAKVSDMTDFGPESAEDYHGFRVCRFDMPKTSDTFISRANIDINDLDLKQALKFDAEMNSGQTGSQKLAEKHYLAYLERERDPARCSWVYCQLGVLFSTNYSLERNEKADFRKADKYFKQAIQLQPEQVSRSLLRARFNMITSLYSADERLKLQIEAYKWMDSVDALNADQLNERWSYGIYTPQESLPESQLATFKSLLRNVLSAEANNLFHTASLTNDPLASFELIRRELPDLKVKTYSGTDKPKASGTLKFHSDEKADVPVAGKEGWGKVVNGVKARLVSKGDYILYGRKPHINLEVKNDSVQKLEIIYPPVFAVDKQEKKGSWSGFGEIEIYNHQGERFDAKWSAGKPFVRPVNANSAYSCSSEIDMYGFSLPEPGRYIARVTFGVQPANGKTFKVSTGWIEFNAVLTDLVDGKPRTAKEALKEAQAYEAVLLYHNKISKEESVNKYLQVAADYPDSPYELKAYFYASVVFSQRPTFPNNIPTDEHRQQARVLWKKMIAKWPELVLYEMAFARHSLAATDKDQFDSLMDFYGWLSTRTEKQKTVSLTKWDDYFFSKKNVTDKLKYLERSLPLDTLEKNLASSHRKPEQLQKIIARFPSTNLAKMAKKVLKDKLKTSATSNSSLDKK